MRLNERQMISKGHYKSRTISQRMSVRFKIDNVSMFFTRITLTSIYYRTEYEMKTRTKTVRYHSKSSVLQIETLS